MYALTVHPSVLVLLWLPQVVCVLIVCFHVLELLFDDAALPRGMEVIDMHAVSPTERPATSSLNIS